MKTEIELQQEADKRYPEPDMQDFAFLALLPDGIEQARKLSQKVGATRQAFVDGYRAAESAKEARIKELSEALESVWRLKDMIGYSDLQLAAHLGEAEAIEKMLHQVKQALNPPTDGSK